MKRNEEEELERISKNKPEKSSRARENDASVQSTL